METEGGHNFLSLRKGRGHEKWAVKMGRVMQIYVSDHVMVMHLMVKVMHLYSAFLCGYIQIRFTTLCGGLCQTAL